MDEICRFCLKISPKSMCSLQECDILYNIQRFLTIEIPTEDSFPNKLCKECFKKISQIIKFCLTVKENEEKLLKYSKNGSLQDYYTKIINNNIKEIKNEQRAFKIESYFVKSEDTDADFDNNADFGNDAAYDNDEAYINDVAYENNTDFDNDVDFDNNAILEKLSDDTYCSSDEEVMLSSKRKKKKIDNITIDTNNMSKVKPIKYLRKDSFKRQNKQIDPESVEYLKQFSCLTCLESCDSKSELIDHYYDKHVFNSEISKSYNTEIDSNGKATYDCNYCEKTFKVERQIVRHVMIHNKDRPLSCKICARTYRTVPEIVRHARAHNGFRYQCPYNCGYTSAYQGAMKEHQSRHLDQYKYNCEVCGKGFNTKTWFDQHQNIHNGLRPFICDICGIAFPMARYLQHHKYSSHPQSSDLKRYSCIHCDEKCDSAKSLSVHMLEHGIKKETNFLCDFCGKVLSSDYQLQYHHRMHAGIKPYSCTICKKKFAKKYNVQLHMTIHTGEKSHACGRCGKVYSQRPTLLRHLKRYHPMPSTKIATET